MVFNKWGEGKKVNSQERGRFLYTETGREHIPRLSLNVLFQKEVLKEYK